MKKLIIISAIIAIISGITGMIANSATIADFILTHFVNRQGEEAIPPSILVIEKHTCNCFQTTCSLCLTRLNTGNHPGNPDPSVLSSHEQPVQPHVESENMMSVKDIKENAKQNEWWYDPFLEQRIANQQAANW